MDDGSPDRGFRRASTWTDNISTERPSQPARRCSITYKANDFPLASSDYQAQETLSVPVEKQAKPSEPQRTLHFAPLKSTRKQQEDNGGDYAAFYIGPPEANPILNKLGKWIRPWHNRQNPRALYGFRDNFKPAECILRQPIHAPKQRLHEILWARTLDGKPAWWCPNCKLVIFDGMDNQGRPQTRTSRGLEVSRKNCPKETVEYQMACLHCMETMGLHSWRYQARVMNGKVCKRCEQRCWNMVDDMEHSILP